MRIVRTISELRAVLKALRENGHRIGFVPTMGCLHEGHAALIRQSGARCDHTVVSIFVNPTQFGPTDELSSYPRELERDQALCLKLDVSVLFLPEPGELYPTAFCTFVEPGQLGDQLCGAYRPGHFRGVATVVTKLFNIVQPDLAFFGQRDLQQTVIIRRIVRDLNLPVDIVVVPTVREPDGLAFGSRNAELEPDDRVRALCLSRALFAAETAFQAGERRPDRLLEQARLHLSAFEGLQYLELVDTQNLEPLGRDVMRTSAMCLAAVIGKIRLIDNVLLAPDPNSAQFTSHLESE